MQLRIAGPRRAMPERRRDQARSPAPPARRRGRAGPPPPNAPDTRPPQAAARSCAARTAPAQLAVADPEQHADALRRRERQIEPGDLDRTRRAPQRRAVCGSMPASTPRRASPSTGPERPSDLPPVPDPAAARLGAAGVVLLDAVADALDHVHAHLGLLEVVPGLAGRELADRKHRSRLSRWRRLSGQIRFDSSRRVVSCRAVGAVPASPDALERWAGRTSGAGCVCLLFGFGLQWAGDSVTCISDAEHCCERETGLRVLAHAAHSSCSRQADLYLPLGVIRLRLHARTAAQIAHRGGVLTLGRCGRSANRIRSRHARRGPNPGPDLSSACQPPVAPARS